MTSQHDCLSIVDPHPEFMPWWTKAKQIFGKEMRTRVSLDGQVHDLTEGSCCFLGEVYGWSDMWQNEIKIWFKKYPTCKICRDFGMEQFVTAQRMTLEEFYKWKSEIYEHIKEKHPKILRRSK